MTVDLSANYNAFTLEFENMYRSADDLQRRTKQTLEVFVKYDNATDATTSAAGLQKFLDDFAANVKTQETTYKAD